GTRRRYPNLQPMPAWHTHRLALTDRRPPPGQALRGRQILYELRIMNYGLRIIRLIAILTDQRPRAEAAAAFSAANEVHAHRRAHPLPHWKCYVEYGVIAEGGIEIRPVRLARRGRTACLARRSPARYRH